MKKYVALLVTFSSFSAFSQVPNYLWAKSIGGTNDEWSGRICADDSGNVLTTGYFISASMTVGTYTLTNSSPPQTDVFVVKYSPSGNVVWAKRFGGPGYDMSTDITSDKNGNVYVSGSSTLKYDRNGNLLWTDSQWGNSICVDTNENVYVAGYALNKFDSAGNNVWSVPVTGEAVAIDVEQRPVFTGRFQTASVTFGSVTLLNTDTGGTGDIFLVKYDTSGSVVWAKGFGGISDESVSGIVIDTNHNIYLVGAFQSPVLVFDSINLSLAGGFNIFLTGFDANGSAIWANGYTCGSNWGMTDIAIDADQNLYVTGYFYCSSVTFGATTLTNVGAPPSFSDFYLMKCNASGNVLWALRGGSSYSETGMGVAIDRQRNILISGMFSLTPILLGSTTLTTAGQEDVYIAKLDTAGITTGAFLTDTDLLPEIYPSPCTGRFTIQCGNNRPVEVVITNIVGQIIYQGGIQNGSQQIDLSSQPNGIYFVNVISEGETVTQKIVIQE